MRQAPGDGAKRSEDGQVGAVALAPVQPHTKESAWTQGAESGAAHGFRVRNVVQDANRENAIEPIRAWQPIAGSTGDLDASGVLRGNVAAKRVRRGGWLHRGDVRGSSLQQNVDEPPGPGADLRHSAALDRRRREERKEHVIEERGG